MTYIFRAFDMTEHRICGYFVAAEKTRPWLIKWARLIAMQVVQRQILHFARFRRNYWCVMSPLTLNFTGVIKPNSLSIISADNNPLFDEWLLLLLLLYYWNYSYK